MAQNRTSIKVRPETRDRVWEAKEGPSETYDDVLNRLLDEKE